MAQVYSGWWDGIVVDVNAPATSPNGSVKVRIPGIHGVTGETDFVPDLYLPWAVPNFMFAGLHCGLIGVPPVNSIVNIIFKQGDRHFPMWIGGGHKVGEIPLEYTAAKQGLEPKGWMWITPGGYGLVIDEVLKTITVKSPQPDQYQFKIDVAAKHLILETPTGQQIKLDETANEVTVKGTTKAILTAALMEIGVGATEAAVLGTAFAQLWIKHGHEYIAPGSGGAPAITSVPLGTGIPPTVPANLPAPLVPGTELSNVSKIK